MGDCLLQKASLRIALFLSTSGTAQETEAEHRKIMMVDTCQK